MQEAEAPAQIRVLIDRAIRIAKAESGVIGADPARRSAGRALSGSAAPARSVLSGVGYAKPKVVPYEADLRRAAEVLNAGKKVAILVGAGALQATDEVIAVADKLGAGAAKALLGKGALPTTCRG